MIRARIFTRKLNGSRLPSKVQCRAKSVAVNPIEYNETKDASEEMQYARPTKDIPGPQALPLLGNWFRFIPYIGEYGAEDTITQMRMLRDRYGDIVKLDKIGARRAIVFLFTPELCEKMYRVEGTWPMRIAMETLNHYRNNREHIYNGQYGLATSQGKLWHDFRSKVNQHMMQP